ncbi:hypothetical protein [Gimesia fumaroli]|uniref:Uncharacterized protein n=1 Tax=Gimesia fumaroli TaxID=2527976 RepID=A0A518IFH3_9PLAN|nr:hypothetical protein [Gimesia fumaroli]QDV51839.1 hypothetical protein Enr17x_38980 [Gimesia fumaroli]
MSGTYINTPFVITNNQSDYPEDQIWVSFSGVFTNTGTPQYIGATQITNFTSNWQSFKLADLLAPVPNLPYFGTTAQYTFSLNGFSGRVYINYGPAALTEPPNPGAPGTSPYLVFEPTVDGETLAPPTPTASNMDLSYVDGVSAPAATMVSNATTGQPLQATSVNPVTSCSNILSNVVNQVPSGAVVSNGTKNVRVMSSAAAPSAYHDWTSLMTTLQKSTATNPLNVCSYTSPTNTGIPVSYALSGALFGYSGGKTYSPQAPDFATAQDYTTQATFKTNLNPDNNSVLTKVGITNGTPGVEISGTGTVTGAFSIYIKETDLNAGTGIYGNNPPYVVAYNGTENAYNTDGIVNDLGGRVVGDLMAGMVFGWSASSVNIEKHALKTGTKLYNTPFSSVTIGGLKTGELFFLLSLAGAQKKLTDWLGSELDSNSDNYDPYLYAIAQNSDAYGSGFTDRLQGYSNPDTYWYTANPPAIPGGGGNYETVGFVDLILGQPTTIPMAILLTNNTTQELTLTNKQLIGSSTTSSFDLPPELAGGSTAGGYSAPASKTPYQAIWTYSPDGGKTELTFQCDLSGPNGITIIPSKTGPDADKWELSEEPTLESGVWVVRFYYSEAS